MKRLLFVGVALAAVYAVDPANAADLPTAPVYKSPAAMPIAGGFYGWVDGSWQQINLPSVGLGQQYLITATRTDNGPVDVLRPQLDGAGIRGGLGYMFPGTSMRLEMGGSYVHADGTARSSQGPSLPETGPVMLSGAASTVGAFYSCSTIGFNCATAATLTTDYTAWEMFGKIASDWKFGAFTVTPFATVFGGNARNSQSLAQSLTQTTTGGALLNAGLYNASTSLNWTDVGARVGFDTSYDVNSWLAVGAGGYLGLADRSASLSGNDTYTYTLPSPLFPTASSVSASASRTAFVANAEAGFSIKPMPAWLIRGFVGLHYDSAVPGISTPSFSGEEGLPPTGAMTPNPAGIRFQNETSYYAGGGIIVRFGS